MSIVVDIGMNLVASKQAIEAREKGVDEPKKIT